MIWFVVAAFAQEQNTEKISVFIQNKKGEPIFAQLLWDGGSVQTNEKGMVLIPVQHPNMDIEIVAQGYIAEIVSFSELQKETKRTLFDEINELIIESEEQIPHPVHQRLNREQVERTAGTHDDPIRLLQSLPGVAQTREYGPSGGDIVLRAAQPQESVILIDGIALPYLYHFQQYASVIHTRLLESVDMYASGYGVSYGNAAGGVVSVETRKLTGDERHYSINGNFVMGGGFYSQKIGTGRLSISGRRSYADVFSSSNDQYSLWPVFWDYLLRFDQPISAQSSWGLSAIGASDRYGRYAFDSESLDPFSRTENPNFLYERTFHGVLGRFSFVNETLHSRTVLGLVQDQWDGRLSQALQERKERYLYARSQHHWLMNDSSSISLGLEGKGSLTDILCTAQNSWFSLGGEAPYLEAGVPVDDTFRDGFVAGWLELRHQGDSFSWYPGIRAQQSIDGEQSLDPRLTVQWESEQLKFRLGGGQYSQLPTFEDNWSSVLKSQQLSSGLEVQGWEDWRLSLDVWGRDIQGRSSGENGWAVGSELLFSYAPSKELFSWFSIQLAHSEEQELFVQPFALNFVYSWQWKPDIDIGLRYRYSSGMPYVPPVGSRYVAQEDRYIPIMDDQATAHLPDYQKLDLHIAKKWYTLGHTIVTYAELWYVPSSANFLYPVYNFNFTEEQLVVGPPIVPLLGIRVEN